MFFKKSNKKLFILGNNYSGSLRIIMALSQQTLDYLLEAEGSIRSAIKSAAINEKPLVITQISKLLYDIESLKEFENLMDVVEKHQSES